MDLLQKKHCPIIRPASQVITGYDINNIAGIKEINFNLFRQFRQMESCIKFIEVNNTDFYPNGYMF